MPDLSSFTQGTSDIAASDFLIGYVSAAGPGSERRWTAQDLTTGLLSLVGATPAELAHLSGTTGNIQSQINTVQASIDDHEVRVDNPHTVTATQVGLGNVDNTSDVDKPVSTLQATAIGVVQADVNAHEVRVDNPHTVTATQVGLGNVDNTSDANKPVSTLQQAAIDAAGGGAFDADGNTLITPSTPIVLGQDTGNEVALTLDYTTNKATSGDDTGLLINQTDTASPGASKLLDLQVGGASKFSVTSGPGGAQLVGTAGYFVGLYGGVTSALFSLNLAGKLGFAYNAGPYLVRDAAGTLAQRNGVEAQTSNIYNTYTSDTDYERAHIGWNDTADTFVIGTEAGSGGGVARDISINAGLVSLQGALNIDATGSYRKGGVTVLDYDSTLFNVSAGGLALSDALLTGSANTATGYAALRDNTEGFNNTASGYAALANNTTGDNNTANGRNALLYNTEGSNNTASGYAALTSNITGLNNTASGRSALELNDTGSGNAASGYAALQSNTAGGFNTAAGYQSGRYQSGGTTALTDASNSVFLGAITKGIQGATNQIVIGDTAESIGANSVILGNDSIVTTALRGNVGIGTTTPGAALDVATTWNDGATVFTGIKADVTNTASAADSKLIDLQVGGASKFSVLDTGGLTISDGSTAGGPTMPYLTLDTAWGDVDITHWGGLLSFRGAGLVGMRLEATTATFGWSTDLILGRDAAATLQLGINDATTPTGQTIKAHDVVNGTGADLTLSGGLGDVANGDVILEGGVVLPNLPTSDPLNAGELWNDSGTLKVSAG